MVRQYIPDDVKKFVVLSIPSVPFLEALLLMRDDDEHAWNAKRLAKRLYMTEAAADQLLRELLAAELLSVVENDMPTYRYYPVSESIRSTVNQLANLYTRNIVEISMLIHSKSSKKSKS